MKILISIVAAAFLLTPAITWADERNEVQRAAGTIDRLHKMADRAIPETVLRNAKGMAIIRVYKAGFGISGRFGNGVLVARTPQGWSGPVFISTAGAGIGPQIGIQASDLVLVLNTQRAVDAFARKANITLGGDVSVAAGPIGRHTGIGVTPLAAIYTYSQSRGLFVGASLEGAVITVRDQSIAQFYGRPFSPRQILSGSVPPPAAAAPLMAVLPGRGQRLAPIAEPPRARAYRH